MLFFFLAHHTRQVAETLPADNLTVTQHVVQSIQFAAAIIALIAGIVFLWADHKDRKEIDAILKKHGIKTK